jgi:peroxiredoxin
LLPLFIIFVAVVFFVEREKRLPLPPPQIQLIAQNMRTSEGTAFTLPDLKGNPISLSAFTGNVVLLNFFATWCSPCREEMPSLEQLFHSYQSRGLIILGLSSDTQGKDVVAPFIEKYGLTFPVLLDPQSQVFNQYRVRGIPTTYLLDRQGRIAGMQTGGLDWNSDAAHKVIEQLLQEQ